MTVPNVSLNDSVKIQNTSTTVNKDIVVTNPSIPDDLQRQPQEDTFNGKSNKKKILIYASIGTVIASLAGIAIDFKFAEGKHVKKLWNKLTGHKPDVKPKTNEAPNIGSKVNDDTIASKATEPKAKPKTTQSEKPKTKTKPVTEPVTEKEYIDRETLSPVKEKWQGKTLLERTVKTEDGLITTYYKNGKIESVFTNVDMFQKLEVYAGDGKTVEETYFRNTGTLYIEKGNKNLAIPHISEEQFKEAVKLSQKYAKIPEEELENLYREVLSGNPKNMSFMEFNVLEAHRDVYKLTIPKTSEATQIKEHHFLSGKNNLYRDNPEKLKGNGKVKSDYTKEEWNALPEEEQDICFENRLIKLHNEEMKQIDKALQALPPLEKDCVFYRGIGERFIPDSIINGKVGDIVVPDNSYAYTAFNRELANRFGGHQYIIRTPKGTKVSRNMEHGGEAVFPRNAEYRIISKSRTPADSIYPNGQWRIELEYILPKS